MAHQYHIFDQCFPTGWQTTETAFADEQSRVGWSGARSRYGSTRADVAISWPTMSHAQAYDMRTRARALNFEVATFEVLVPGEEEPRRARFALPPQYTIRGFDQVEVRATLRLL